MVYAARMPGTGPAVRRSIDLDPASSKVAQKKKAKRYFTQRILPSEWHGRIFMNPPYCRDALAGLCSTICFTRGRIPFVSPYGEANAPVHGSAFFYLGSCPARFVEEFGAIGLVVLPVVGT